MAKKTIIFTKKPKKTIILKRKPMRKPGKLA
jgi:hypothetical protein